MVTEGLEIRMARLEGAYEQISERLGGLGREIVALRSEFKSEMAMLRSELTSEIGGVRAEVAGLRSDVKAEIGGLRSELKADHGSVRSEIAELRSDLRSDGRDLRRAMSTQFYWLLTLVLGSILIPILRDLAVVR